MSPLKRILKKCLDNNLIIKAIESGNIKEVKYLHSLGFNGNEKINEEKCSLKMLQYLSSIGYNINFFE